MDFSKLAQDLVKEILEFGISKAILAKRLGIARPTLYHKIKANTFTVQDLNVLGAVSVTLCGGNVLMNFIKPSKERISNGK